MPSAHQQKRLGSIRLCKDNPQLLQYLALAMSPEKFHQGLLSLRKASALLTSTAIRLPTREQAGLRRLYQAIAQ